MRTLFITVVLVLISTVAMAKNGVVTQEEYINSMFVRYSKPDAVSVILKGREGIVSIETDNGIEDYSGRPSSEYISGRTVLRDLKILGLDVLEFSDLIHQEFNKPKKYIKINGQYFRCRNEKLKIEIQHSYRPPPVEEKKNGKGKAPVDHTKAVIAKNTNDVNALYTEYMNAKSMSNTWVRESKMYKLMQSLRRRQAPPEISRSISEEIGVVNQMVWDRTISLLSKAGVKTTGTYEANFGDSGRRFTAKNSTKAVANERSAGYPTIGRPYSDKWRQAMGG